MQRYKMLVVLVISLMSLMVPSAAVAEEIIFVEATFNEVVGLTSPGSVVVSADGEYVYVGSSFPESVITVFKRNFQSGKLTVAHIYQEGANGFTGIEGVSFLLSSGDSKYLYVLGSSTLAMFERNLLDGSLTLVQTLTDDAGGVDGLNSGFGMTLSPDEKHIYVVSSGDVSIAAFSRNAQNGTLTFVEALKGSAIGDMTNPQDIIVSPDNAHVYAISFSNGSTTGLAAFSRNTTTGSLTLIQSVSNMHFAGGSGLTIDPVNGVDIYTTAVNADTVAHYQRNSTTGQVSFVEGYTKDNTNPLLENVRKVQASADGEFLYLLSGFTSNALIILDRVPGDGSLQVVATLQDGVNNIDSLSNPRQLVISPDSKHVYVVAASDEAVSVFNRNTNEGSLTVSEIIRRSDIGTVGLDGAAEFVISPDGQHIYVAGSSESAIGVFRRDIETGKLTYVEAQINGLNGVDGLTFVGLIAISPDGKHVYTFGRTSNAKNAIAVFSRDATSGRLLFLRVITNDDIGQNVLNFARDIIVSPDNANVYIAITASSNYRVLAFSRDANTGNLSLIDVEEDNQNGLQLTAPTSLVVSPDGKQLYVAADIEDALVIFTRNTTDGTLTFNSSLKDNQNGVDGLSSVDSIHLSPEGTHLYALTLASSFNPSFNDQGVALFSRNAADGSLTFVSYTQYDDSSLGALNRPKAFAFDLNPEYVYITGDQDDALNVYRRDTTTGALTLLETLRDNQNGVDGLDFVTDLAIAPDGRHLYASSSVDDSLAGFRKPHMYVPMMLKR